MNEFRGPDLLGGEQVYASTRYWIAMVIAPVLTFVPDPAGAESAELYAAQTAGGADQTSPTASPSTALGDQFPSTTASPTQVPDQPQPSTSDAQGTAPAISTTGTTASTTGDAPSTTTGDWTVGQSTTNPAMSGTTGSGSMGAVAPTLSYGYMFVRSADAQSFYYLRQDHFRGLGRSDVERMTRLKALASFGPNPVGSGFPVRFGENYVFVPVCSGTLDQRRMELKRLSYGDNDDQVTLKCR